jgi:cell division protease FtsH
MDKKNTNNKNQQNKKPFGFLKNKETVVLIIVILVAVVFMVVYNSTNTKIEKVNYSQVITDVQDGKIAGVNRQGGSEIVEILYVDQSKEEKEDFPKSYKYYTVVDSFAWDRMQEVILTYNKNNGENADITLTLDSTPVDVWSKIVPIIYVAILLISLFMIYKFITRAGGGKVGSFGKGKIKNGEISKIKFSDIAGINEEKAELEEIVDFLKEPKKYTDIGARIPKGVLLVGNPGTGKTLLAKAIAGESGVPFFSISGSDFVEMFVGVGASRVRDLFEEAKKNAPCIIFIDEIDAVGRRRGTGMNGGNDEREQTLNQLLVEMDGFDGNEGIIIIAATNRADILDPALTRPGRFDRKVMIYPPDIKGREDILKIHAKNKKIAKDVDFKVLARITSGFTGANLESLMNEAALRAAKLGKIEISMVDITESINKVTIGVQKKDRVMLDKDKEITAYHESGHAILGLLLPKCNEVQEVSIIPRGFAGGYTSVRENDEMHVTLGKLNDEIAMTMGGRLAEIIHFGDYTTGASNDIVQATKLANKMVTEWGMSDLGFINYSDNEDMFLSSGFRNSSISVKALEQVDTQIKKILDYNYQRAEKLLRENVQLLDSMAKVLIARETIYKNDLEQLLAGVSADDLIKIIDERELRKQKEQDYEIIKRDICKALEESAKSKKSLVRMEQTGLVSKEQYVKLFEGLKAEYEQKVAKIKEKAKTLTLNFNIDNYLVKFEDLQDSEPLTQELLNLSSVIVEEVKEEKIEPLNDDKKDENHSNDKENSNETK